MDHGELHGHIKLTEEEKRLSTEALRTHGFNESAAAMENVGTKEIHPSAARFIMDSVRRLAELGRADAQAMLEAYQEMA